MQVDHSYSAAAENNIEGLDEEDRYIIFEVIYDKHSPVYLPKMLMNICFKFLMADEVLKSDLELLLQITANVNNNSRVIEFNH